MRLIDLVDYQENQSMIGIFNCIGSDKPLSRIADACKFVNYGNKHYVFYMPIKMKPPEEVPTGIYYACTKKLNMRKKIVEHNFNEGLKEGNLVYDFSHVPICYVMSSPRRGGFFKIDQYALDKFPWLTGFAGSKTMGAIVIDWLNKIEKKVHQA